jgi:hypothetical protein
MTEKISYAEFIKKVTGVTLTPVQEEIVKYVNNGGRLSIDICRTKLNFNKIIDGLHNHYIINGVHGPECPCSSK